MTPREERLRLLKSAAFWAAVLGGYYIFTRLTGLYIPCVFRLVTGLKCPGCGVSHMAVHAAHFEFAEAFTSNPLLFIMIPFLLGLFVVRVVFLPDRLKANSRTLNVICFVCIGLLIVFGVVRNIIGI